ncbi:unnamed protein product [Cuscuta campestris]|uniref:Uncharacterized protein n=1 Tax=Cuscuta campestris TaxID=132261 RepID=A0A484NDM7_9ASTE|nr:unnamed protein product [Cuscuta campestris]
MGRNRSQLHPATETIEGELINLCHLPLPCPIKGYHNTLHSSPFLTKFHSILLLGVRRTRWCCHIGVRSPELRAIVAGSFVRKSSKPLFTLEACSLEKAIDACAWKLTAFQRLDFTCDDVLDYLKKDNFIGKGGADIIYNGLMPNGEQVDACSLEKAIDACAWKLTAFQRLDFTCDDVLDYLKKDNFIGKGGADIIYNGLMPNGEQVDVNRFPAMSHGFT